jgi:hypothetical protein
MALLPLALEVCQLTGAPLLAPPAIRKLLETLSADLAAHSYALVETAERVWTACVASTPSMELSPRDVIFILRGMQLNGHAFGRGQDAVPTLAQRLCNQILFLCQREQMPLDDSARLKVRRWVGGGLLD